MSRNNMDRLGLDDSTPTGGAESPVAEVSAPTGGSQPLAFSIPTEHIELPSQGKFYGEKHALHNQETIEIKYMTAKEEDILTSPSLLKKGLTIDRLLRSVIIDKTIDPQHLLVGDRNAILVGSRVTGYGADYKVNIACPACASHNEMEVDLSEVNLNHGGVDNAYGYKVVHTGGTEYEITLPKTDVRVTVKLLTGRDESNITASTNKRKKHKVETGLLTTQLKALIVAVNGNRQQNDIEQFIEIMPAFDSRYLRNTYDKICPNVDMSYPFTCDQCDHETEVEVPLSAEFFWPK